MNYDDLLILRQNTADSLKRIDRLLEGERSLPLLDDMPDRKRMEYIIDAICDYADTPKDRIIEKNQTRGILLYRQIACYILLEHADISCRVVRDRLNYDNNSSVFINRTKIKLWMEEPRYAPKEIYLTVKNILTKLGYEN
jgi:chromosomal replication initiation ATPase DnaA